MLCVISVVECPSVDYLGSLAENETWAMYHSGTAGSEDVEIIVHFTPSMVMNSPAYKDWISK